MPVRAMILPVDHLSRAVDPDRLDTAIRNETVEYLLDHCPEMLFRIATPFSGPPKGLVPDHPILDIIAWSF
jgi:hypothetical protein